MTEPAAASITPRYRLLEQIGEGAMGVVFRAHDRLGGRDVALKRVPIPPGAREADPAALRLALAHEFRTLAGLRHPHIVSVLDYGFDAGRQPFFTMELLGGSVTVLEAGATLPAAGRAALAAEALDALAYLHRRDILHHDLKPANMLVADGRLRLLDFGLAVLGHQTRDDDVFGTLRYLAPEVLDGRPYAAAADVYSAGVVAFELLAGRHPFPAEATGAFVEQVLSGEPDLAALSAEPALALAVGRMLARDPAARPSAGEAAAALRAAAGLPAAESGAVRESYLQAAAFVGRGRELGLLAEALAAAREGRGGAWLVGGESGIGKSRLLDELRARALVEGFLVLRGQAAEGGRGPHQLWRDVARQLLAGEDVGDPQAGALAALAPDAARLLGREVPPAAPLGRREARARLLATLAGLVAGQGRPTLLLLEDLQWAGDLEPLPAICRAAPGRPLLVVASYRDDEAPGLAAELPAMSHLPLPRLSEGEVARLAEAMLGEAGRRPELLELLGRESEGNTFFIVEAARALAEEAGDLAAVGRAGLPASLTPSGVRDVVERRLARAPGWARPLLELAAAAGRQVEPALLRELDPAADVEGRWLPACAEAGVLEVQAGAWQFRHDKLREGLLAQLAPEELRRRHADVARGLARLRGGDDRWAARLAHHWGLAGEPEEEAAACLRAGRHALQQGSPAEAERLLARALELPAGRAARLEALARRGAARELAGAWAGADEDYRAALSLAEGPEAAEQQLALGRVCRMRGGHAEALEWLARAERSSRAAGDRAGMVLAATEASAVLERQGEYAAARARAREALGLAREAGDARAVARTLGRMGHAAYLQSDYAAARSALEESLAISRALGDRAEAARALKDLGNVAVDRGEYAAARALLEEALALGRAAGDATGTADALNNLGNVASLEGRRAEARRLYQESLALRRAAGDRWGEALALNNLGNVAYALGEHAEARRVLEECLALQKAIGDTGGMAYSLCSLGSVAAVSGDADAARARYAESLALCEGLGDRTLRAYCLAGLAEVAVALGDPAQAARLAGAAESLLAQTGAALEPTERARLDRAEAAARAALGPAPFQFAAAGGASMSLEEALRYARG